jgi:hypothetical protein
VDTAGLIAAAGVHATRAGSARNAVVRAASRDIVLVDPSETATATESSEASEALSETRAFIAELAAKAAAREMFEEYERAVKADTDRAAMGITVSTSKSRRLDEWAEQVTRHSRDAERASFAKAAATAAKRDFAEQWTAFQATKALPNDPFMRELAIRALATERETETLRETVALTTLKLQASERAAAEKRLALVELHEKAKRVAEKDAEARDAESKALEIKARIPPVAALVPRDLPDLKHLSARIARELDESVRRVTRAVRGETADDVADRASFSKTTTTPYPIVAHPVAPVARGRAPARTRAQADQYEEQLRAERRLAQCQDEARQREERDEKRLDATVQRDARSIRGVSKRVSITRVFFVRARAGTSRGSRREGYGRRNRFRRSNEVFS